jgi:hypothetical protein
MMKFPNVLLACALGAGSLLGAAAPASAAHLSVGTSRTVTTGRVVQKRYYRTVYRTTVYRGYGYGQPYSYGYPYGVGVGLGVGYGYGAGVGYGYGAGLGYGYSAGVGYGYAPYPAVYAPRPYWRPHRRVFWRRRVIY